MLRDILGTQTVNVSVNAGGTALWVCTLAAVLCGAAAWDAKHETRAVRSETANELRAMREKMDVMQAHLSAIYMQAPHLKPESDQ